jgi:hypothetical protein
MQPKAFSPQKSMAAVSVTPANAMAAQNGQIMAAQNGQIMIAQ